jgi:hypothetical protein
MSSRALFFRAWRSLFFLRLPRRYAPRNDRYFLLLTAGAKERTSSRLIYFFNQLFALHALFAFFTVNFDQAIKLRGTSMRNYRDSSGEKGEFLSLIKVYGKEGKKCVKCKQLVKKIDQAGRSTFFCSSCQK